jgi:hypothetical protein
MQRSHGFPASAADVVCAPLAVINKNTGVKDIKA